MAIKDMKMINVLNYNQNIVIISTKHDSYAIDPAIDSDNPTVLPLTLDEILYVNSSSAAFKSGILRFQEDVEQEMYDDILRIANWRELLKINEIENIILHPTVEGLTKLINIKDIGVFDRVRGVFVRLKNTTDNDISMRVESIINARFDELKRGIRNTGIIVRAKDTVSAIETEEVNALKEQNKALQEQMEQMQKMMEQMMAMQQANSETNSDNSNDDKTNENTDNEPIQKKAGRPKKNQ